MQLKAACLQLTSVADLDANLAMIESMLAEAAHGGAELIALPENAFYMRAEGGKPLPRYSQDEHPGVIAAQGWARAYKVWVLVGSVAVVPQDTSETRLANRALLIDPAGAIICAYDKIHLFDVEVGDGQTYRESERVCPGTRAELAHTPWGDIGLTICYDARFPQLYRALAQRGANILTVPAAFTQVTGEAHWHVLLRARAIENGCFVIAPAQCGEHPGGRRTYGHSLIIDPWGRVLADGGEAPGIVTATLELDEIARVRKSLPSLKHDREFS